MSENLSNKTCGQCQHFSCSDEGQCMDNEWTFYDSDACDKFQSKVVTNGDKIRQMSNAELAKLIVPKVMFCDGCPVRCEEKDIPQIKDNPFGADVIEDVCTKRLEAWLNAPAKSEGEDE